MELECVASDSQDCAAEPLDVCFVDTLGDTTYLGLTGWPPRLLINAAWWRTATPAARHGALSVMAGEREGVTPQEVGLYGHHARDLPAERHAASIFHRQTPQWWQALLIYELPAVVVGLTCIGPPGWL